MSCPFTNAIFGLIGVFIGGLIGHWLTLVRDSTARKRTFLAFLKQWRVEIFSAKQASGYWSGNPNKAAYHARIPSFHAEVERVRGVFSDSQRFEFLTSRLGSLKAEDWQNKQPCDVILEALDALVEFCK